MKKLFVGLAAAVLLPAALFAVDLSYGAKAGAGAAMLTGSDWTDMLDDKGDINSLKLSVSAAAFLNIGLSDSLSIQPEAGYTVLGGKGSKDDRTYMRYTFNVLEVPVFLIPKFAAGPGTLVAFAGPDLFLALGNLKWVEIEVLARADESDRWFEMVHRRTERPGGVLHEAKREAVIPHRGGLIFKAQSPAGWPRASSSGELGNWRRSIR